MGRETIMVDRDERRCSSLAWAAITGLAMVIGSGVGCGRIDDIGLGGFRDHKGGHKGGHGGAGGTPGQPTCATPDLASGVWSEIPGLAGQEGFQVNDAFAAGTDDVFLAGVIPNPDGTYTPRILRWKHGCWSVELTFAVSTPIFYLGPSVHGTGPNDVWAVGGDFIYHRDAVGWSLFADDSWRDLLVREPPNYLVRVRTAGSNDLWVLEEGHVLHFDGYHWTAFNFDDANYPLESGSMRFAFTDIWIDGPNDVWVVGPTDQVGNTMDPALLHHFDGYAWARVSAGVFHPYALWRAGAALWIALPGIFETIDDQLQQITLRRYDATTPIPVGVPIQGVELGGPGSITSLWGRNATDVWGAGDDVAHFDGQAWSLVAGIPDAARGVFAGTHVTGDARAVWLSTPGPRFFRMPHAP